MSPSARLYGATMLSGATTPTIIAICPRRFLTAYRPRGRPTWPIFGFAKAFFEGRSLDVFNHDKMMRGCHLRRNVAEGVAQVILAAEGKFRLGEIQQPSILAPGRICNMRNHWLVKLLDFVEILNCKLRHQAKKNFLPMQDGNVAAIYARSSAVQHFVGLASSVF
ncbi:MAG: hypothetical protein OEL88_02235 [Sterolibacteriaceae bacterium MAG5]|nr:hypothetical protein [Candidatus Nitricoxidireducens bremensis]